MSPDQAQEIEWAIQALEITLRAQWVAERNTDADRRNLALKIHEATVRDERS